MEDERDILIAYLPEPRDFQLANDRHWYRIRSPELLRRKAPKFDRLTHIAFYLPASFGSERYCVRYIAPIIGWGMSKQDDLAGSGG